MTQNFQKKNKNKLKNILIIWKNKKYNKIKKINLNKLTQL